MSVPTNAPATPPGWETVASTLLVLDDPTGTARAWFAPARLHGPCEGP